MSNEEEHRSRKASFSSNPSRTAKCNCVACGSNLSWLLLVRICFWERDIPGNRLALSHSVAVLMTGSALLTARSTCLVKPVHIRQGIKAMSILRQDLCSSGTVNLQLVIDVCSTVNYADREHATSPTRWDGLKTSLPRLLAIKSINFSTRRERGFMRLLVKVSWHPWWKIERASVNRNAVDSKREQIIPIKTSS